MNRSGQLISLPPQHNPLLKIVMFMSGFHRYDLMASYTGVNSHVYVWIFTVLATWWWYLYYFTKVTMHSLKKVFIKLIIIYAKQKHLGCKERQGQSEATITVQRVFVTRTLMSRLTEFATLKSVTFSIPWLFYHVRFCNCLVLCLSPLDVYTSIFC